MSRPAKIIEAEAFGPVMVEVTSPSTLKEGYTFDAVHNGQVFPVTIPQGGVKGGQTFSVPFVPNVSTQIEVETVVETIAVAVAVADVVWDGLWWCHEAFNHNVPVR